MEKLKNLLPDLPAPTSTPNPQEQARQWPTDQFSQAGYPNRHRLALQAALDARGGADAFAGGEIMPWKGKALERLRAARKEVLGGDCLLGLIGPRGTGKTQMAVELGLTLDRQFVLDNPGHTFSSLSQQAPAQKYYVLGQLLDLQKATFGRDIRPADTPIGKAEQVDLLVLDEVQEIVQTEWQLTTVTRLIDARYQALKRTILIGNLTPSGLSQALGSSITSRMTETGLLVPCDWPSFRDK
ncbi:MAG: hypothetical protein QF615_00200 [Planctomycetota bacterium]|jgi:DNA replication protein DnaC|nr:hypothetical protein [Planctomycetota bacterium]